MDLWEAVLLNALKFAAIGIANKDYVPDLVHFNIAGGKVRAFDGLMSVQCPIGIDIQARPHAKDMLKAIAACMDTKAPLAISTTQAGKISLKAGDFTAYVKCLPLDEQSVVFPSPTGTFVPVSKEILASLQVLAPFMAVDASRPWAMGVRFAGDCAYVTNNVVLIQRWHGAALPREVIIPAATVKEIVRIDREPQYLQLDETSVTFWYDENTWLRSQLVDGVWPENIEKIFEAPDAVFEPVSKQIFPALEKLRVFADDRDRVYFREGSISTHETPGEGATVALQVATGGLYNGKQLRALDGVAQAIDWGYYPKPAPFKGEKLRGVICGMRG